MIGLLTIRPGYIEMFTMRGYVKQWIGVERALGMGRGTFRVDVDPKHLESVKRYATHWAPEDSEPADAEELGKAAAKVNAALRLLGQTERKAREVQEDLSAARAELRQAIQALETLRKG